MATCDRPDVRNDTHLLVEPELLEFLNCLSKPFDAEARTFDIKAHERLRAGIIERLLALKPGQP